MADANLSAARPPAHASPHPMAGPGYGKRAAPGQLPRTNHDFAHLPAREAAIAGYVDRLADGADISVKTLAKMLPYGQCALRTALNNLHRAGHLRRGRERLTAGSGGSHWITRTWFTRTPRDDGWWVTFTRGGVPEEPPEPARPARSRAHILLAALGREAPVLSLSAADCAALAPLVTEWHTRGAPDEDVLRALTAGLPTPVHQAAALVRRRLTDKLPPEPPAPPDPGVRGVRGAGAPGGPAGGRVRWLPGRTRPRTPHLTPVRPSRSRPRGRDPGCSVGETRREDTRMTAPTVRRHHPGARWRKRTSPSTS